MSVRLQHPQFGLDSTSEVPTAAHRSAGSSFAVRYLTRYAPKALTETEVRNYKASGLGLAVVFEDGAQNALGGLDRGKADAEFASNQARALGMPAERPIYFAVDFDTGASPERTDAYFDGVAAVLGKQCSGAYGGFEVVRHQFDRGFHWGWQTLAWSGSALDVRAQLYQFSINHHVGGVGVDYNHAYYQDYGQWGVTPPPDPDPHHYQRFPEGPFAWQHKDLYERWLVQEYDKLRVAPHLGPNSEQLDLLREDINLARKRVWVEANFDQAGNRLEKPTWGLYYRGWRWQQLLARSRGQRVV